MTQELMKMVMEYQNNGILLTDSEAEMVCDYCCRKMKVAGIQNQEEYLPLLYADELRNYLFRREVNAITIRMMMGKETSANV